jgi:hypothetical protein
MKPPVPAAPKKPYQAPKLLVYGSLTEMTQNSTSNPRHHPDGAKLGTKRRT